MTSQVQTIVAVGLTADVVGLLTARLHDVGIREADDVDGVLRELDRGDVSLLIINHTLTGLSAVDVLSRTRAQSAYRHLPVIYLLDRRLDSAIGRTLLEQLGVQRLLLHPVDADEVVAEVAHVLNISLIEVPEVQMLSAPEPQGPFASAPESGQALPPGLSVGDYGHILVIDGDGNRGLKLAAEAAARGIRASIATTSSEAREAWEHERPDAVLLDLSIRNGNGEEGLPLLEELSALSPPVPVLVMTGRDTFIDRVQVASFGGRGFLQRSAPPGEILDIVMRVLQQLRANESRVLLVNDDPAELNELGKMLEETGIRVTTLDDPLRFWDTLEQMAPDLLVLDLDLSRWSGIELCRVVRNDPRWGTLPVLILTPRSDANIVSSIFAAGADDYVIKPVVGPELVTKIVNRLERTLLFRSMAEIDPMTGVANRRKSTDTLRQFLRLAERHTQPLSLALLDVDWFKQINDRYGHGSGDAVLQHLGKLLLRTFRSEDIVARWGGEEFLIGMYGMTRLDGVQRLSDLLETVRYESLPGASGEKIRITFSAGVAQYPEDGTDVQALYRVADQALYRAKQSGRDRVMGAGWEGERAEPGVQNVDIVLVDSDADLGNLLVQTLEGQGYRTQWMRDGETAALALGGVDPALRAPVVLLDSELPGLDGMGVLRRLDRDQIPRRTRIIMLSRCRDNASWDRAAELGAFDQVTKPFAIPALVQKIRRALEVL